MKILHLTHHSGCQSNIEYIIKTLGHEITTMPEVYSWNYNIGHKRAEELWNKHKEYFESFDLIITSDTAPLSRIFLQNNYKGKLIIWVSNRFNYFDGATNDCNFPDQEFYDMFKESKNVKIFSYTKFENEYAKKYGVYWRNEIIKPCVEIDKVDFVSAFPENINKSEVFFIPPYHNDTIFMDLKGKCNQLGIPVYAGRYNGPLDLLDVKGIIHIPYAWANFALQEQWSMGKVYFIPSKAFLLKLSKQSNFWWQDSWALDNLIESSEWYCPENQSLFMYFNDWNHLKELAQQNDLIQNKSKQILEFSKQHNIKSLNQWENALK